MGKTTTAKKVESNVDSLAKQKAEQKARIKALKRRASAGCERSAVELAKLLNVNGSAKTLNFEVAKVEAFTSRSETRNRYTKKGEARLRSKMRFLPSSEGDLDAMLSEHKQPSRAFRQMIPAAFEAAGYKENKSEAEWRADQIPIAFHFGDRTENEKGEAMSFTVYYKRK